ncbi:PAS domain S-box protein [Clostridium sp. DL1XJH146]
MFMKTPMATVILDNGNNIVDLNSSFTKLLEFNKKDVVGKNLKSVIVNKKLLEDDVEDTLNKIKEGILVTKRSKRISKGGKVLDVEITSFPLINYDLLFN